MQDLLASGGRVLREEGRVAHQHLVEDDSQGPPVNGLVVALLLEHLRGNVVGGPHGAERELPVPLERELTLRLGQLLGLHLRAMQLLEVLIQLFRPDLSPFTKPEVAELDVAREVQQYVVGLEVAVDVVHLVHLLHSEDLHSM